jgi:hypothetical protein
MRIRLPGYMTRFLDAETGGAGGGDQQQQKTGETGGDQQKTGGDAGGADDKGATSLLHMADKTGDGTGEQQQTQQTGEGTKATPYKLEKRPDWLPENFFDAKTGEVKIEALAASQRDLRTQLAKGPNKAPEKADDYAITLPEQDADKFKAIFKDGDPTKDPVVAALKPIAHKLKLSAEQFNGLVLEAGQSLGKLVGDAIPTMDVKAEMEKLGPKAKEQINAMKARIDHFAKLGVLSNEEVEEVEIACGTVTGFRALQKIMEHYGERPIPSEAAAMQVNTGDHSSLQAELAAAMTEAQKGTPGAQQKYEAIMKKYEAMFGNAPAGSSLVMPSR